MFLYFLIKQTGRYGCKLQPLENVLFVQVLHERPKECVGRTKGAPASTSVWRVPGDGLVWSAVAHTPGAIYSHCCCSHIMRNLQPLLLLLTHSHCCCSHKISSLQPLLLLAHQEQSKATVVVAHTLEQSIATFAAHTNLAIYSHCCCSHTRAIHSHCCCSHKFNNRQPLLLLTQI